MKTSLSMTRSRLRWVVGVVLLLFSLGQAQPAHAIVGAATVNPYMAIGGAVMIGAGVSIPPITSAVGHASCREHPYTFCSWSTVMASYFSYIPASALVIAGIILLPDENTGGTLELASLTTNERREVSKFAGQDDSALNAFEDERAEIQAVIQDIALALRRRLQVSSQVVDQEQLIEWSRQEWVARQSALSPEAFRQMGILSQYALTPKASR